MPPTSDKRGTPVVEIFVARPAGVRYAAACRTIHGIADTRRLEARPFADRLPPEAVGTAPGRGGIRGAGRRRPQFCAEGQRKLPDRGTCDNGGNRAAVEPDA